MIHHGSFQCYFAKECNDLGISRCVDDAGKCHLEIASVEVIRIRVELVEYSY